MEKVVKSVTINAPREKVFEYIADPLNLLDWQPSVTDVRDVSGHGIGQKWTWAYKMVGVPFTGKAEVTESVLNASRHVKTTGGIKSEWIFRFRDDGLGTRMDLEIDYTVPVPLLGKIGELLIVNRNERVMDMAMTNVKERMEG